MENIMKIIDRLSAVEESSHSAHKRIDSIEKLTESVYSLATSIKAMQHDITDVSGRLKIIEEKPSKRWDLIITTLITAVVTAFVTYLIK